MLEHEDPDTAHATGTISTEEEMDAAAALLSLGEVRDDTLDDDNDNAELMPIGGQNVPVDIAPQPIRLDQMSVDNAIAGMIQSEEQTKDAMTKEQVEDQPEQSMPASKLDDVSKLDDGPATKKTDQRYRRPGQNRTCNERDTKNENLHPQEDKLTPNERSLQVQ